MADEMKEECREHHHYHRSHAEYSLGPLWFIGWLFTIGYVHMPFFWKGVLALIIWPYYLGNYLGSIAARPPL
jgi:hypothetical protein